MSRLENGRQTPSEADLRAWADAVGRTDLAGELVARRNGLETQYRSWRRQRSAGHRARQEVAIVETAATKMIRGVETARIPGLLQTPEYARTMLSSAAAFQGVSKDIEDAVRARIRRQAALYEPGKTFRFLVWEAALYMLVCPPQVMAQQLDRLGSLIGLDTVELGIIPLGAQLGRTPAHGSWIYDRRLVIVETINAEMWLDDQDSVTLYERAWEWLADSAAYDTTARRLISRAQAALDGA